MTKRLDDDALANVSGAGDEQTIKLQEDPQPAGSQTLDDKMEANENETGGSSSSERRTSLQE